MLKIVLRGFAQEKGSLTGLPQPFLEFEGMQRLVDLVLEARISDGDHHEADVLLEVLAHVGVAHNVVEEGQHRHQVMPLVEMIHLESRFLASFQERVLPSNDLIHLGYQDQWQEPRRR